MLFLSHCAIAELDRQYVLLESRITFWNGSWTLERNAAIDKKRRQRIKLLLNGWLIRWKSVIAQILKTQFCWRMEFMFVTFWNDFFTIAWKDNQRDFTHVQKLTIFRRDKGLYNPKLKCNGEKWNGIIGTADHIVPWSKGGKTTVENA